MDNNNNKFALIGYPLGHSMSPLIHRELFKISGVDASYELVEIAPEKLQQSRQELEKFSGFNITIPHKTAVIPMTDKLDGSAMRYNSVNCIIHNPDGRFIGYNTDCDGFLRSVSGMPLDAKVLILGCGGVGRMIAIETALHGGEVTLAVIPQDLKNAELLETEIREKCTSPCVRIILIDEITEKYDLLINATPVGMYPKTDACAVSDEVIANCENIFDVIYNPTETLLMKKARAMGKKAVGGTAMLVYQAVKAHEIWYGGKFTQEEISGIITAVEREVDRMNLK